MTFAKAFEEYKKTVDAGDAFGYINDSELAEDSFSHSLSDIAYQIKEVNWDVSSGIVSGTVELLNTLQSECVRHIIEENGEVGIAPKMLTESNENGSHSVLEICSFDVCHESAWPDAKLKPLEQPN